MMFIALQWGLSPLILRAPSSRERPLSLCGWPGGVPAPCLPPAVNASARAALIQAEPGTVPAVDLCQIGHIMPSHAKRDKPLAWLHGEIKTPPFSAAARVEAGVLLRRLQRGESLAMPLSRPMPDIGNACHELRIRDADRTWRIMYCVRSEVIVILDVFAKTTTKTPKYVVKTCRKRLRHYQQT